MLSRSEQRRMAANRYILAAMRCARWPARTLCSVKNGTAATSIFSDTSGTSSASTYSQRTEVLGTKSNAHE